MAPPAGQAAVSPPAAAGDRACAWQPARGRRGHAPDTAIAQQGAGRGRGRVRFSAVRARPARLDRHRRRSAGAGQRHAAAGRTGAPAPQHAGATRQRRAAPGHAAVRRAGPRARRGGAIVGRGAAAAPATAGRARAGPGASASGWAAGRPDHQLCGRDQPGGRRLVLREAARLDGGRHRTARAPVGAARAPGVGGAAQRALDPAGPRHDAAPLGRRGVRAVRATGARALD